MVGGNAEEVSQMEEGVDGLKSIHKNFEVDCEFGRGPAKLVEDGRTGGGEVAMW